MSLVTGVRTESSLGVVNWLGGRRSDVRVICFKVLDRDPLLEIVDTMSPDPYLNLLL
jgi:hypothetical protein